MIHDIGVALQFKLRERGCPIPVVDGPERTKPASFARERIVLEETQDTFGPPLVTRGNPPRRFEAREGVKMTIYAQSPAAGALLFEHKDRAKQIRNMALVALDDVIRGALKCQWTQTGGTFVAPDDLKDSEQPPGAVYELTFAVARGVFEVTWTGDKAPEGTVTAFGGTGEVTRNGTTEVSCTG